jgi:hypothetical protein
LAWLQERRGRWAEAEQLYKDVDERYDDPTRLYEFYTRAVTAGQARYAKARDALVAAAFPDGQQKVTALPSGPPISGAQVTSLDIKVKLAGLAWHDVIVALDGIRVENARQFAILRLTGTDPNMRFVLYRAETYREVAATFKDRKIAASFGNFPSRR